MYWYLKVLKQYADFSGRARRKEYWMFFLFNFLIFIIGLSVLDVLLAFVLLAFRVSGFLFPSIIRLLDRLYILYILDRLYILHRLYVLLYALAVLIPSLAVSVRRLHDIGKSGWWILITLIPLVGGFWLFVLSLIEGHSCDNQYGKNPKKPESGAVALTQVETRIVVCVAGALLVLFLTGILLLPYFNLSYLIGLILVIIILLTTLIRRNNQRRCGFRVVLP
jgi:uncharacterized membrane protein YhaH (DUF805 family)